MDRAQLVADLAEKTMDLRQARGNLSDVVKQMNNVVLMRAYINFLEAFLAYFGVVGEVLDLDEKESR